MKSTVGSGVKPSRACNRASLGFTRPIPHRVSTIQNSRRHAVAQSSAAGVTNPDGTTTLAVFQSLPANGALEFEIRLASDQPAETAAQDLNAR